MKLSCWLSLVLSMDSHQEAVNLELLRSCSLCILCGRPSEASVLAQSLGANHRILGLHVQGVNDSHRFFLGQIALPQGLKPVKYYITAGLNQGIESCAIASIGLFTALRPQYAIASGVCAAYSGSDIRIGNVILSASATNYEGNYPAGREGGTIPALSLQGPHGNIGDLMERFVEREGKSLRYGSFATGAAVREDAQDIFKWLRGQLGPSVIGLDMEASAFFSACEYGEVTALGVIKGVSDLGDANKKAAARAYEDVLQNTATAIEKWVRYAIPVKGDPVVSTNGLANLKYLRDIPVCIICTESAEAKALAQALGARTEINGESVAEVSDRYSFFVGELPNGNSSSLSFYIASSPLERVQPFSEQIAALFKVLRPKFSVHAGTCMAASTKSVSPGKVIFADQVVHFDAMQHSNPANPVPRPYTLHASISGMQEVATRAHSNAEYGSLVTMWPSCPDAKAALDHIIKNVDRDAIAVDMQAGEFLKACKGLGVQSLGTIKGVVGHSGPAPGQTGRSLQIAIGNGAAAIKEWLPYAIT